MEVRRGGKGKNVFNRTMAKVSAISGGEMWGTWGTSSWLFPFLVLYDWVPEGESEVLFVLYAIGQVASVFINRLSLRRDVTTVRVSLVTFVVSLTLVSFLRYFPLLYAVSPILGVSSFLYRPPTDSIIVRMNRENAGTSMGLANAVSQVGSMIAPLVVGPSYLSGIPNWLS
ncbi:MFS transporter [Sulfuracidifex tepidarius]|uniref:MFS transporter n=1 Tax=Sulfuracidifex tepidarius TaxID=1294262 RepID=UPI0006D23B07|nr:MFS transporter [Sulfuracidifex tepidarius]